MASIQPSLLGLEEVGARDCQHYFEIFWVDDFYLNVHSSGKIKFWRLIFAMICVWVHTWHTDGFFPQTVFPHWGVLTLGVKAGAWSLTLGRGILPVNFRTKWLLWNLDMQARTKCSSAFWAHFGLRHFTCKFPHKVFLVKSWHAFRLRSLAQSLRRGSAAYYQ